MKPYIPMLAAATLTLLSACGQSEPEVVGGPADPMADQVANAATITLPPSVKASKTYRCKGNSLVFVDFMSDDKTAILRTEKNGAPTSLAAETAGGPFKAEGYEVSGSGSTIDATVPGKGTLSCKA